MATPDFSGYWTVVKVDNCDGFLKDLGFPWIVRKMASKYGMMATDIISQTPGCLKIVTVNAKGAWTRRLVDGKEVAQRDPLGVPCKIRSWWEGKVHKSRLECAARGATESSRYMEAGTMVVRTSAQLESGKETVMFWYLERITPPQGPRSLLSSRAGRVERDQQRVQRATAADTAYLQSLVAQLGKWETPADRFLGVGASGASTSAPPHVGSHKDLQNLAMSPLPSPHSSLAVSGPSSTVASPFAPPPPDPSLTASGPLSNPIVAPRPVTLPATAAGGAPGLGGSALTGSGGLPPMVPGPRSNESGGGDSSLAPSVADSAFGGNLRQHPLDGSHAPVSPSARSHNLSHHAAPAQQNGMTRSPSAPRVTSSYAGSEPEKSPGSNSRPRAPPACREEELARRLQDFADTRSITSVLPLDNPLASEEPELLEMSPEQAEDTQLKLVELEDAILRGATKRQAYAAGWECLYCTCVCHPFTVPAYVRSWDL